MKLIQRIRIKLDTWHQGYYIEKYILRDGEKHPVAIICPGGGYHWVCSFIEGLPCEGWFEDAVKFWEAVRKKQ